MNTFCPECGTKLKKEAHFCPECGFEIKNVQSSQPTQTKPLREPKTQEPKKQVSQERIQERKAKNSDETVSFNLPLKPIILLLVICGVLYGGYYLYTNYLQKSDTQTEQTQNEKSEENTEQEKTGNETNKESGNSETENNENTGNSENKENTETSSNSYEEETKNTQTETTQNTSSNTSSTKFRVITDKAYFYDSADTPNSNSSYLIRGDYVEVSPAKSGNTKYFVHFTNSAGIITTGYIRKADLQAISDEEVATEREQDEENTMFIQEHYKDMRDKNWYTAYNNYLYPKAKSVNDFANWYTDTYNIELGDIHKIGLNDYRFRVVVSSYDSITTYETSMKIGKVDGILRILGYTSKKIN